MDALGCDFVNGVNKSRKRIDNDGLSQLLILRVEDFMVKRDFGTVKNNYKSVKI